MKSIRKIIIGKEPTENSMNYAVGQKAVRGKYKIDSILEKEEGGFDIYIKSVEIEDEVLLWKTVHKDMPTILEFSQSFNND